MAQTFDEAALLEQVDGDVEFLRETAEMLTSDGPALAAEVRAAISAGDAARVGRAAHTLKGMVSNFHAAEAQQAALVLERLGKSGDLSGAAGAMETMESALRALTEELARFIEARS